MVKRLVVAVSCTVLALVGVIAVNPSPASAARGCVDVHVLFARGTTEVAPPLGVTGIAFENSLRERLHGESLRVEPVHYRASNNFDNRIAFLETFVTGVKRAQKRAAQIAARCPDTAIVLGGYSQGAALVAYSAADSYAIPPAYEKYRQYAPKPMAADIAPHVKAIVLFAPPSDRFLRDAGAPRMRVGKAYRDKTVHYCIPADTVCNGSRLQLPTGIHVLYAINGMTNSAADYVARRV